MSVAHGFATLWQTANLTHRLSADPTIDLIHGIAALGHLATMMLNNPPNPDPG